MFTTEYYRARAAEYSERAKMAGSADKARECQMLERSFTELADNAQWVTDNHDQTLHAAKHGGEAPLAVE